MRWGDLTPEQRAAVPVGSEMRMPDMASIVKCDDGRWSFECEHGTRIDPGTAWEIARLGPEIDRSAWPVLVRASDDYWWCDGDLAIGKYDEGGTRWSAWPPGPKVARLGFYPTALAAADAIKARLPEARTARAEDRAAILNIHTAIAAEREELRDIAARHYCAPSRAPSPTLLDALNALAALAGSPGIDDLLRIVRREVGL